VTTTQLAGRISGAAAAYLLLEHASEPLAGLTLPSAGEVFVIVGPEGGVTPAEVERLRSAGARPVRLGSTVLRSSSAGPAALAVLNAAGRWR
jgi:16S rRNA (uracil1498-N3)-methyltransferase